MIKNDGMIVQKQLKQTKIIYVLTLWNKSKDTVVFRRQVTRGETAPRQQCLF